jgi:malate synthase
MGGTEILAPAPPGAEGVLDDSLLVLLAELARRHREPLQRLLAEREAAQARYDAGQLPGYLPETAAIREADWTCAPTPHDLLDRRVEITGPVDRKTVINALNSGASAFMADFEDATTPTWTNLLEGQRNLIDAVRRTISYTHPQTGKHYALSEKTAVLMVRPRGLHLPEAHVQVDGEVIPGALFDAATFLFHNARELVARGTGPYLYVPKLQSWREAAWWHEVLTAIESSLGLPLGTVKVTMLIETLPAAFQMDEMLYAMRDRAVGLNCGRWDYIFSAIKVVQAHSDRIMPDRDAIGMTQPFLRAYTRSLVRVCHRRGVHAMGGMAAQIPIKDDPAANEAALAKVRADKEREASDGHDGTWVAHPGLVAVAREIFDDALGDRPHQRHVTQQDAQFGEAELLAHPQGPRTEQGLRTNLRVGVQYLAAWLSGVGCVPLDHRMEDAATAEISRAQVWQWVRHNASLDDGTPVTAERVTRLLAELGQQEELRAASSMFLELCTSPVLAPFLTTPAYARLSRGGL